MADPGLTGEPHGEGRHREIILPLALDELSEFWGRLPEFWADGETLPAWRTWNFGVDRREGHADLFVLGRISTRVSRRVTRTYTAAAPMLRWPDADVTRDDAEHLITDKLIRLGLPGPLITAPITGYMEFDRDTPYISSRRSPVVGLDRLAVLPSPDEVFGPALSCDHHDAEWVTRDDLLAFVLACPRCGTSHLAVTAFHQVDAKRETLTADYLMGEAELHGSDPVPSLQALVERDGSVDLDEMRRRAVAVSDGGDGP